MVDTASMVIDYLVKDLNPPLNYSTISDGDLWLIFVSNLIVRGPSTLRVSKVKGHATEEDLRNGKSTQFLKDGNDGADAQATTGLENRSNHLHATS